MAVDDDERQPLLASRSEEQRASDHWLTRGVSAIRSSWPVYQAILLLFIYQVSYYSTAAAQIDLVRELTCARYYEQHPNLIDPTDDQPCSSDQIESQAAHILLVLELLVGLGSAVSTIQFGQKFSTWGRKPVLLISLFTIVLFPAVCIVVPRGYPYGPLPSEAIISPTKCIYILAAGCTITGLLGANALPICCYRLLVVDHSDTAERTKNLVYVMVAYLSGLMIGPLISAAASYIAPISALGVDGALISIYHHLFRSNASDRQLFLTNKAQVGLVTPFIVCLIGGLFSVFYVIFFVKETAFSTQAAAEVGNETSENEEAAPTDAPASKAPFTPLQALMPIKQKDGSYDMRIAALFTTMVLVYCGGASLDILVVFFGHAMQWTPSSVGYLISSLGATRLVTVFAVLPSLLVFLERTVRRPTSIAHHTVKELHKISKASSSEETPTDESAYVSERDLDNTRLLQGAISLWRARIDYSIIKLSWM
jgi:MFS family permease